jgi:hypothetical protein
MKKRQTNNGEFKLFMCTNNEIHQSIFHSFYTLTMTKKDPTDPPAPPPQEIKAALSFHCNYNLCLITASVDFFLINTITNAYLFISSLKNIKLFFIMAHFKGK